MTEFPSVPNEISHKDLNALFLAAYKDNPISDSDAMQYFPGNSELHELLNEWAQTSQEVLEILKEKDSKMLNKLKPKQIMALGALEAHLTLSMQAKSAIDQDH